MEFSWPEYWRGSFSLLQGIFPTQGWNPGLPHCRWILYQLNHKGSPRILEWVAYPFSRRSSLPSNQTGVSCICRQILYQLSYEGSPIAYQFSSVAQSCWTLCGSMDYTGQNTGVGSCSLLQGIFPNQGSNPDLPHCRRILYQLNHKGSPRILEWVAYPFSSGSF